MNIAIVLFLFLSSVVTDLSFAEKCSPTKSSNTKLFCYYGKLKDVNSCKCSHVILPPNSDVKSVESLRSKLTGVKILVTVHEFNEVCMNFLRQNNVFTHNIINNLLGVTYVKFLSNYLNFLMTYWKKIVFFF